MLSVYQNLVSAHAYDLLSPGEKTFYDTMEYITAVFWGDSDNHFSAIKGTTWSGSLFSLKISDPLAVLNQMAASISVNKSFALTAIIPLVLTLFFGRFYCGWICPATFLYELNTSFGLLLEKVGIYTGARRLDKRMKYWVLAVGLLLSTFSGSVLIALIYPPAIIGRELYYSIALSGFGSGAVFFLVTILFDLLVARRGFCRYLCPGGALYSLLGRFRLFRLRRLVGRCNDCEKCSAVCEFDLNPMKDDFGQECNNCTACVSVCPTEAITFVVSPRDIPPQGPGHLGKQYRLEGSID